MTDSRKRILILDGGGIRGFFGYQLLQNIKHDIERPLKNMFDLIVGVSAGAIVGAMIATGNADENDGTDFLGRYGPTIFGTKNPGGPIFGPKYDGIGKRDLLMRLFGKIRMEEISVPLAILTSTMRGEMVLVRSYDPTYGKLLLVDVLDASTAAPSLFPPVYIETFGWLVDGGILENSPFATTLLEILSLYPKFGENNIRILSIGTKNNIISPINIKNVGQLGILTWLSNGLIDMLIGANNNTNELIVRKFIGADNMIRILPIQNYDIDAVHAIPNILADANIVWEKNKELIKKNILMI